MVWSLQDMTCPWDLLVLAASVASLQCKVILAFQSTLTFNGSISFTNNAHNARLRDGRGGAMYLYISSTFSILPHMTVCWENNHASLGGAIYVGNYNPLIYCTQITTFIQQKCFFQIFTVNLLPQVSNLFSRTTLLISQEVCYMVAK